MYSEVVLKQRGGGTGRDRGNVDQGRARQVQEYTCLTGQWQEQLDHPLPLGFDNVAPRGVGGARRQRGPRCSEQTSSFTPSVPWHLERIIHLIYLPWRSCRHAGMCPVRLQSDGKQCIQRITTLFWLIPRLLIPYSMRMVTIGFSGQAWLFKSFDDCVMCLLNIYKIQQQFPKKHTLTPTNPLISYF